MQWAGANNPLWIIRHNSGSAVELVETKPDKQPIGKYSEAKPFTNHEIEIQTGDLIFIFTDGFADQFGGPDGKKFKYANFQKLFLENVAQNSEIQKTKLETEFMSWKGDLEQVDDVCIIGIRI